jgi:carboxyl-terminal processing protease
MSKNFHKIIIFSLLVIAFFCIGVSWPEIRSGLYTSNQTSLGAQGGSGGNNPTELFSECYDRILNQFYKPVDATKLKYAAVSGLYSATGDPHTSYFPPKAAKEFMELTRGNISGIGAMLAPDRLGARIRKVIPGTPAAESEFKAGDLIIAVNGTNISGMSLDKIVEKIRGPEGTSVTLRLVRNHGPQPIEKTVVRRQVTIPTVEFKHFKEQGIGYIALSSFTEFTPTQFDKVLEGMKAKKLRGLIIDLRWNGGGFLEAAANILSRFVNGKVAVSMRGRDGKPQYVYTQKGHVYPFKYPIVVLINEDSASAAEIFAGVLRDYKLATLLGTHTYGKASVQSPITLYDGAVAKITIARYYLPKGEDIDRKVDEDMQYVKGGLKPDIEVPFEPNSGFESGDPKTDLQVRKAIEVILKKSAQPKVIAKPVKR